MTDHIDGRRGIRTVPDSGVVEAASEDALVAMLPPLPSACAIVVSRRLAYRSRSRGSITAYSTSTRRVTRTKIVATTNVTPWTTG
jgi:hypothetical protein